MGSSYGGKDPRDLPNYPLLEVAQCIRVNPQTLARWIRHPALFRPAKVSPPTLSFWNLVEAATVRVMRRNHKVPMSRVRAALEYVEKKLGIERPLIHQGFLTDGVDLFVERFSALENVSRGGQLAMRVVLEKALSRVEVDADGLAGRFYPWAGHPDEPKVVIVDPRVSFGRVCLIGTGIPTGVLTERYNAGDSIEHLAEDYGIHPDKVEAGIAWEMGEAA